MRLRNKIYFILIATAYFIAVFFALVATAKAEVAVNDVQEQEIVGPGEHETNLTSLEPWLVDGAVVGSVASYVFADATTRRPVDYWEFYDEGGDVVAIAWFDQFGVRRIAVDEGIMNDEGKLDGRFVLVLDGEAV